MKITATHETSLLELLQETFPDASTNKIKKVIRCGCVRHNNAVVKHPELVLKRGETIEYTKYEAKRTYRERTSAPMAPWWHHSSHRACPLRVRPWADCARSTTSSTPTSPGSTAVA